MADIDASTTRIGTTLMRGMPAETRWRAGDLGGAAKDVERALADAAEQGQRFWVPELLRLEAELAIARGAPAGEALLCSMRPSPPPMRKARRRWPPGLGRHAPSSPTDAR